MFQKYCQVIINNNSKSTDAIYTYGVPNCLLKKIDIGKRVKVTFSRKKETVDALVVQLTDITDIALDKIKPILGIIDDEVIVKPEMIKLAIWIRDRYVCKYSDTIRLMVPSQIKYEHNKKIFMQMDKIIYLNDPVKDVEDYDLKRSPKQRYTVECLIREGKIPIKEFSDKYSISNSVINALIKKNIIGFEEKLYIDDNKSTSENYINELNEEQYLCYDSIVNSNEKIFLIHGVTGSGKTEVYINLIDYYRKLKKQSILLVPEISLTTQTIMRLENAFGKRIAVFHSKLTTKQKYIEWKRVLRNEVDVVIGARSALFAPIKSLGVIIVDEEHEDSYKSSSSPKYDAIEVAIKRGILENAKVVLGSATPSLRTFNMVINNHIKLLQIKKRANDATMPEVKIIDMKNEIEKGNDTLLSVELYKRIKYCLKHGEQVILFINRRGYSNFISCKKCGYVVKCDNCDVSMTYHSNINKLKCHYCGNTKSVITECPKCGSQRIEQFGFGTQQVEELIKKVFTNAIVERMDTDTMSKKNSFNKIYNDFREHKIDIIIGTQMLAKGLDFPDVTTVGVLSADSIINLPFYNSGEKTFQLLTQVSGRAGRSSKKGYVYIQTYEPDNFIVNAAKNSNIQEFLNEEFMLRKEFAYPPFVHVINVCTISKDEELLKNVSEEKYLQLKNRIKEMFNDRGVLLYSPTPNAIYKINNEYRMNLYMKTSLKNAQKLKNIIREVYMKKDIKNIKVSINIDTENV